MTVSFLLKEELHCESRIQPCYNNSRQNFHVRNKCTKILKLLDEKRGKGNFTQKAGSYRLHLLLLLFKVFFIRCGCHMQGKSEGSFGSQLSSTTWASAIRGHQVCHLLNHLACLYFGVCKSVFGYVDAESN